MLRYLAFFQAIYDCHLHAVHIPLATNRFTDLLSRNRTSGEINKALHSPTQVPSDLVSLLCIQTLDWTSQCWRDLFCTFGAGLAPSTRKILCYRMEVVPVICHSLFPPSLPHLLRERDPACHLPWAGKVVHLYNEVLPGCTRILPLAL